MQDSESTQPLPTTTTRLDEVSQATREFAESGVITRLFNRRQALLAAFGISLGSMKHLSAQAPAHLTVPLDHWAGIKFTHGKRSVTITGAEIFRVLSGEKP